VRQFAAVLLSCALFSSVLLAGSPHEAYAQGYSGQAVVEDAQYAYGTPSYGKAGDLVFFDEAGYGISHVGIATGYGTVIHASTYYGAVVETPIEYIPGYVGAVDAY
jgi:cell wall-associated NlpC family hydrolase